MSAIRKIQFCGGKKGRSCCPEVIIKEDKVIIGGKEKGEGFARFTPDQFSNFVKEAKNGLFDDYVRADTD